MDLICVNSLFSSDTLEFYAKYGVVTPQKGSFYTVRDVIINSSGHTGILLEEIHNPKIPIIHPIMGVAQMEPNWNINRFTNIDGSEVDALALRRQLTLETVINYEKETKIRSL